MKKPSSYLTMSIIISTDLQLLTYIHVWNIDKNLFFNYRGKLGKNMQIEPRKNYMQRKNSPNQPQPLPLLPFLRQSRF